MRSGPVESGQRAEQAPGVGVLRVIEDLVELPVLDDLPRVHHQHPVGDLGDDPEIVGDQDRRQAASRLRSSDQVEDLGLDRHVERRGRLVGDQQLGSQASAIAIIARWRMPPENSCG